MGGVPGLPIQDLCVGGVIINNNLTTSQHIPGRSIIAGVLLLEYRIVVGPMLPCITTEQE